MLLVHTPPREVHHFRLRDQDGDEDIERGRPSPNVRRRTMSWFGQEDHAERRNNRSQTRDSSTAGRMQNGNGRNLRDHNLERVTSLETHSSSSRRWPTLSLKIEHNLVCFYVVSRSTWLLSTLVLLCSQLLYTSMHQCITINHHIYLRLKQCQTLRNHPWWISRFKVRHSFSIPKRLIYDPWSQQASSGMLRPFEPRPTISERWTHGPHWGSTINYVLSFSHSNTFCTVSTFLSLNIPVINCHPHSIRYLGGPSFSFDVADIVKFCLLCWQPWGNNIREYYYGDVCPVRNVPVAELQ